MKKALALLLIAALLCSVFPLYVFARVVQNFSFTPSKTTYYFETDGHWQMHEQAQEQFVYDIFLRQGDVLCVTDGENTQQEYTCVFNEQTRELEFLAENGDVIATDEVSVTAEQENSWGIGEHHYTVHFENHAYDVTVEVVENPVSAIRYEPAHPRTCYFESGGNYETGFNSETYYHYRFLRTEEGDCLYLTDAEGVQTAYIAKWDDARRCLYYESADGLVIDESELDIYDEQHREPFSMGDENVYYIKYCGRTCTVPVSIIRSTIQSITYTPVKPIVLYNNTGGQWESDEHGEPFYHYFGATRMLNGDILTVTNEENESTDYISRWNEAQNRREYISADGTIISDTDIRFVDEQSRQPFTLGDHNYIYVEYGGKTAAVPVSVRENPIRAVQFTPAQPAVIYENTGGRWETDAQGHEWYNYANPRFCQGDVLAVTYADSGETIEYTYSENGDFLNANGEALETDDLLYTSHEGRWSTGAQDNVYYVYYYEVQSNPVPVSIPASPIAQIEYIQTQERVCFFETGGEWDADDEGQLYYRYHYAQVQQGDILKVTAADHSVIAYTAQWDNTLFAFRFVAENGSVIEENELQFFDFQHNAHFVIGEDNPYYVEYMGKQACLTVAVRNSPLKSFTYLPAEDNLFYAQTNGYWTTDEQGDPYFHYFIPGAESGDKLILTYQDDTQKTFTAFWDSASGDILLRCGKEQFSERELEFFDDQYETHFTMGENLYHVRLLGQVADITLTIVPNPVKAVEFIPVKPIRLIENIHGSWREDEESGEAYFDYDLPGFTQGDVLNITDADNTVNVYTYIYDEQSEQWGFFDSKMNALDRSRLFSEREWDAKWSRGAENAFWVSYCGVDSNIVFVEIIENPVRQITYTPAKAPVYFEHSNGYWVDWVSESAFYYYELPRMRPGDVLTLTDQNGTSTAYTLGEDEYENPCFLSAEGERIETDQVMFDSAQYDAPWTCGGQNAYTVAYGGVSTTLYVNIVENTVADFAFIPRQEIVIDECTGGRFEEDYYQYDVPIFDGDALLITYKSGAVTEYIFDVKAMVLRARDGREIDAYDLSVYSEQYAQAWLPNADNVFYIEYAGIEKSVPVTIRQTYDVRVVEPSCTAWGYTLHYRAESELSYQSNFTPPLGHDYSLMVQSEQARRTAAGSAEGSTYFFTCSRCGECSVEEDLFFRPHTGSLSGMVDAEQLYREVSITLYRDGAAVESTSLLEQNAFRFDNLEPGTYCLLIQGAITPAVEIRGLEVSADTVLNLNESDNEALQCIAISTGDVNADHVIDIGDVSALLASGVYGSSAESDDPGYEAQKDINDDGVIDMDDIAILLFAQNYGARTTLIQAG